MVENRGASALPNLNASKSWHSGIPEARVGLLPTPAGDKAGTLEELRNDLALGWPAAVMGLLRPPLPLPSPALPLPSPATVGSQGWTTWLS